MKPKYKSPQPTEYAKAIASKEKYTPKKLRESPIKEESQDELWKVVSKIIHSTHRMEDALGKLNCQFHITRKQ